MYKWNINLRVKNTKQLTLPNQDNWDYQACLMSLSHLFHCKLNKAPKRSSKNLTAF